MEGQSAQWLRQVSLRGAACLPRRNAQRLCNTQRPRRYKFANGDVYEGEYLNDLRHGKGKLTHANGIVFDGSWVSGVRAGVVRLRSRDHAAF